MALAKALPESSRRVGRASTDETKDLPLGADLRLPKYRREVFLRFYEFHLENRSHPGCVYYAMPWLAKRHKLDEEQKLWLAFLNGNTQNIVTSWIIFREFPAIPKIPLLAQWFNANYSSLAWDTDRRYHKKDFVKSVECYRELVGGSQRKYFASFNGEDEKDTYNKLWAALRADFYTFGRLSAFSYSEYLRIMGVPIEVGTLYLRDLEGSKSHRNGLAKVLGRDDLDWHKSNVVFSGDYTDEEFRWLDREGDLLLVEARQRTAKNKRIDPREVTFFTMESALCTYKSWHRPNRRYANVYNDMFYERIRKAEATFGKQPDTTQFWNCREDSTPIHLLLERNIMDPGLVPDKQNFYRETGRPIMMSKRWPEFDNAFDRKIWP